MEGPELRRFLRLPWANLARLRRPLVRCVRVRAGTRRFTVRPTNGDLSMGGVFIDGHTLPVGTPVEITLECRTPICAKGIVRFIERGLVPKRSRPIRASRKRRGKALPAEARKAKVGMGIEFTELSPRDLKRLEELVARIPWP